MSTIARALNALEFLLATGTPFEQACYATCREFQVGDQALTDIYEEKRMESHLAWQAHI